MIALVSAHNAGVIFITISLGFIILCICSGISKRREARRSNYNRAALNSRPLTQHDVYGHR